ncbi:MAG: DNA polymerase III subunit delta' [Bacteroidota bacterium]|nr:DNA polymerase III subunit delta' [Bacteroidota bacterium]MDP4225400.1 DNA polymerase III subunit delta' [Bacteroidota bacterium]MDP4274009.1 DNA polymerase III subunit delta' [Bacteroidota bacterium]
MLFKDIIGQQDVKQRLVQSVKENRISHAQLLLGPEGSGNLALAVAYAQFISCADKKDDDSCGLCPSCRKYQKLIHPDLHFVFPVNSTTSVSDNFIAQWRTTLLDNPYMSLNQWYEAIGMDNKQGLIPVRESDEIIRKLNMKSYESEYKVMIMWMPEKMNVQTANKLLKMLEEPPAKTLFLLVSESTGDILPTILSRTQIIKVPGIDNHSLAKALGARFQLSEEATGNIVQLANGNYIRALNLINEGEESAYNFEMFVKIMRLCWKRDVFGINDWVDEISKIGRERQKRFFLNSLRMVRENFLLNLNNEQLIHLTAKERDFSMNFHKFINFKNVEQIALEFNKASADIEWNGNAKIVFFDMSLKLIQLIRK